MTDSQKLTSILDMMAALIKSGEKECEDRLEMDMLIMGYVVHLKNGFSLLARSIAESPAFSEQRQSILDQASQLETVCERLEHIIKNAGPPGTGRPSDG